jgi:hypothetical protein
MSGRGGAKLGGGQGVESIEKNKKLNIIFLDLLAMKVVFAQ